MKMGAVSLILSLLMAIPGEAFGPPAYVATFIADTNKILDVRDQTEAPSLEEMRKMTALACNAIKNLLNDKQFPDRHDGGYKDECSYGGGEKDSGSRLGELHKWLLAI